MFETHCLPDNAAISKYKAETTFFPRQSSQNSSLNWARASAAQPTMKHETQLIGRFFFLLATIKQAVSVVTLAVSATQPD